MLFQVAFLGTMLVLDYYSGFWHLWRERLDERLSAALTASMRSAQTDGRCNGYVRLITPAEYATLPKKLFRIVKLK